MQTSGQVRFNSPSPHEKVGKGVEANLTALSDYPSMHLQHPRNAQMLLFPLRYIYKHRRLSIPH